MYDCNNKVGESCYRLIARNGEFIYLRTQGCLDIDQENQVGSFVCRNTLVSEEEGLDLIAKMKNRFVIMIREKRLSKPNHLEVDGPSQLEDAIRSMITKLPHSTENVVPANSVHSNTMNEARNIYGRNLQSPFAYIIPKIDTIPDSIDKSVRFIAVTGRRRSDSEDDGCDGSSPRASTISNIEYTPAGSASIGKSLNDYRTNDKTDRILGGKRMPGSRKPIASNCEPMSPPTYQAPRSAKTLITSGDEEPAAIPSVNLRVPPLPTSADYFDQPHIEEDNAKFGRYLGTNPSTGKPILMARFPNQCENNIRDFCSSVGGFKYDRQSESQPSSNKRSSTAVQNEGFSSQTAQKRPLSSDNFPALNTTKRKVFITLNAAHMAASSAASELDQQLHQSKSQNPPHIQEYAQTQQVLPTYEDSGVDQMSDGGSSGKLNRKMNQSLS